MTDAVIEYRDEDTGTVFRWHGGAYIDVGTYAVLSMRAEGYSPPGIDWDDFYAHDVINVWNYGGYNGRPDVSDLELAARDAPRPFRHILELFEARCREYLEQEEDE